MPLAFTAALIALLFASLGPGPAFGNSIPERVQPRFQQLLDLMDSNKDRAIDRDELQAYLKSQTGEITKKLAAAGFIVQSQDSEALDRFLKRQAAFIFNNAGRGRGIMEDRLAEFENAQLEYPFGGAMKDLLPPPPEEPEPLSAFRAQPNQVSAEETGWLNDAWTRLKDVGSWISVRKSFLDAKDIGRPATFGLTHFGSSDATREAGSASTVFDIHGAISLADPRFDSPREIGNMSLLWNPVAVYEADMSTDTDPAAGQITHRIGAEGTLYRTKPTRWWSGHNFKVTFDYTTDREYRSVLLGGTAQYTPNFRLIGIGEYMQLGQLPFFFQWRPYIGITGAGVVNDGGIASVEKMGSYANAYLRSSADLLIGTRLHITPEVTWFNALLNGARNYGLFSLSLRYSVDDDDHVSIEAAYTRGKASPEFIDRDEVTFGLGIKF